MSSTTGVHVMVRRTHEERVLAALRTRGALTRAALAEHVGLSRTTLSEITAHLLGRGAIVVANTDAPTRVGSGRPAERLALDPHSGQFLGVDFQRRRVVAAIADASHEILASVSEEYDQQTSWKDRISRGFEVVDRLSRDARIHLGALQGIGVGVPSIYRGEDTGPFADRWELLAPAGVDEAFGERFGAPVIVDNNTRLAALAEAISRPDAVENLLYLRLSDGVGGGLVVAGRLVTGSRGLAGEFGHVTVNPAGSECRCGKRGCLETIASVPSILRACREAGADVATLDELADAVAEGNSGTDSVLREVGTVVGRVLGMAAMTLNPSEVVIGGDIAQIAPVLVEQAAATVRCELHTLPAVGPRIVRAAVLQNDAGVRGAIAITFRQSPLLAGYPEPTGSGVGVNRRKSVS